MTFLKKHGLVLTYDEVNSILDFLYLLAQTTSRDELTQTTIPGPLVEI